MNAPLLSLSTDQVMAFVELARQGSLRAAAEELLISEQGLRSRLLTLEERLGVELYRKQRGIRRSQPLTSQGHRFLPHALAFLESTRSLQELFQSRSASRELHIVGSQYLIAYALLPAVQAFHAAFPDVHVRLSARTEREIEEDLLTQGEIAFGVAAPYESSADLDYHPLFAMDWSLITPRRHPLLSRDDVRLQHLTPYPLILYERGSTGRQHVIEAFYAQGLSPQVELEATNTDLIVRMVEAGLGLSVVPLLPSGEVTRGRRVAVRSLGKQIRPIHSGVLTRRGDRLLDPCRELIEFIRRAVKAPPPKRR